MSAPRKQGDVWRWFADRRFGFIRGEDGNSLFVHACMVQGALALQVGQRVSYVPGVDRTGRPEAKHVVAE
jgi:cold shock CspA family protein